MTTIDLSEPTLEKSDEKKIEHQDSATRRAHFNKQAAIEDEEATSPV
jgi:hypothetical protein